MTAILLAALALSDTVTVVDRHGVRGCWPCDFYTVRVTAFACDTLAHVELSGEAALLYEPKYRWVPRPPCSR